MAMTRSNMREVKEQFKALQLPIDEETNEKKNNNNKEMKWEIEKERDRKYSEWRNKKKILR